MEQECAKTKAEWVARGHDFLARQDQIKRDTYDRGPSLFEKAEITLHDFMRASNASQAPPHETGGWKSGGGDVLHNGHRTYKVLEAMGFKDDGWVQETPESIGLYMNPGNNSQTDVTQKSYSKSPFTSASTNCWLAGPIC